MLCFGIQLLDYSKLAVNSKNDNGLTISWYDIIVKFFDVVFFSYQVQLLVQVSCQCHHWFWSYEVLTGIPEIRNTPVWVLVNIWRLRRVRDIKFGTHVSNKMLLYAGKCQGYSFCRFWVIKGKPSGSGWGGEGGESDPD